MERLRDAIESGDLVELEEAIARAKSNEALYSPRSGLSSNASLSATNQRLLAKAEDLLSQRLAQCTPYLRKLRTACERLDEQQILDALIPLHNAPEEVRLAMYTDVWRAEELRETIAAAKREALAVLGCGEVSRIDDFLRLHGAVLEERMVAALLQKREDLLRYPSLRSHSVIVHTDGGGSSRAVAAPPPSSSSFSPWTRSAAAKRGASASLIFEQEVSQRLSLVTAEQRARVALYSQAIECEAGALSGRPPQASAARRAASTSLLASVPRVSSSTAAAGAPAASSRSFASTAPSPHRARSVTDKRKSQQTPNVSPIKGSAAAEHSAAASDVLYDGAQRAAADVARIPHNGSAAHRASPSESYSLLMDPSQRLMKRVKAVVQEEDMRRRDLEGTEDFDRSVFLFPTHARIRLLNRKYAQQLHHF